MKGFDNVAAVHGTVEGRNIFPLFSHISDGGFETVARARCEELPLEIRGPENGKPTPKKKDKDKDKRNVPPPGGGEMWVAA